MLSIQSSFKKRWHNTSLSILKMLSSLSASLLTQLTWTAQLPTSQRRRHTPWPFLHTIHPHLRQSLSELLCQTETTRYLSWLMMDKINRLENLIPQKHLLLATRIILKTTKKLKAVSWMPKSKFQLGAWKPFSWFKIALLILLRKLRS